MAREVEVFFTPADGRCIVRCGTPEHPRIFLLGGGDSLHELRPHTPPESYLQSGLAIRRMRVVDEFPLFPETRKAVYREYCVCVSAIADRAFIILLLLMICGNIPRVGLDDALAKAEKILEKQGVLKVAMETPLDAETKAQLREHRDRLPRGGELGKLIAYWLDEK